MFSLALDPTYMEEHPMATLATFDPKDLETKVKAMYRKVAEDPHGEFHFEMGRGEIARDHTACADPLWSRLDLTAYERSIRTPRTNA